MFIIVLLKNLISHLLRFHLQLRWGSQECRQSQTKIPWSNFWTNRNCPERPKSFEKPALCFCSSNLPWSCLLWQRNVWVLEQDAHWCDPRHASQWTLASCQDIQRHLLTILHYHWMDNLLHLVKATINLALDDSIMIGTSSCTIFCFRCYIMWVNFRLNWGSNRVQKEYQSTLRSILLALKSS